MAAVSAADVKKLREMTDLPMMLCKNALTEAEGDFDRAIDVLKREVDKVKVKRAENVTAEGRIFTVVKDDCSEGVMVEIQCESAPVAGGEDLQKMGDVLAQQLMTGPGAQTPDELLQQTAPGENVTLAEQFDGMINKIREKIVLTRLTRQKGSVGAYVHHDGKTGVLFRASGKEGCSPVLRDTAMHIAALRPNVTNPEELDDSLVQEERQRLTEEAKSTGKPDNIVEKIVDGRMKAFYVEHGVLVLQPFAKEESKTVSQALAEHGLKAEGYDLWRIGEQGG